MLRASATVNGVGSEQAHSILRCADAAGERGVDPSAGRWLWHPAEGLDADGFIEASGTGRPQRLTGFQTRTRCSKIST
jgi:hypothetical protein